MPPLIARAHDSRRDLLNDILTAEYIPWLLAAVAGLLAVLFILRRRRGKDRLQKVFDEISFDRIEGLVIPNGDDGEIQIDHMLLTSRGLLVVDIKHVAGKVFGSDKMQDWTVIAADRRFTFSNPQPALYDRVAAVAHIVRQVPVSGRVLFLDGAEFTKGVPENVATLDELLAQFGEADKAAAKFKIDAFRPHWEQLRKAAVKPGSAAAALQGSRS
jgi:hypothetical protein